MAKQSENPNHNFYFVSAQNYSVRLNQTKSFLLAPKYRDKANFHMMFLMGEKNETNYGAFFKMKVVSV